MCNRSSKARCCTASIKAARCTRSNCRPANACGSPPKSSARGSETAFIVKEGGRYWFFNERGELVIGKLTRDGYEEIDRAKIIEPSNFAFGREVVWCMPAFAHKKMFVRNDKEIVCIDLSSAAGG